jgi:alpha-beta hydrolase superfamily lysophospholipase
MVLLGLASIIVLAIAAVAAVLVLDAPVRPAPLASVNEPFAAVDYSDLPAVQTYSARDGATLGYRVYGGSSENIVILIHGSSDDGAGMHLLAKALRDTGATVYVPGMRGHHGSGRAGDIDYVGQLEDDLADLVSVLPRRHADSRLSLIGFSSGGGFVLRVIAGPQERLFDRFIVISPALPPGSPTIRPNTGGWVSLALPRVITLSILNRIGITAFNGLPIIAFATSPKAPNLTSAYSFRLASDFAAPRDYLNGLAQSRKPVALLVGGSDELFYPERFAPLLGPVRSDMPVTIVPGVGHIGMILTPEGISAVRTAFLHPSE